MLITSLESCNQGAFLIRFPEALQNLPLTSHKIKFNRAILTIILPRQLRTWEYYRQNRTIKLDFMRRQRQVLECFWKSDQKSTLIAGFRTRNKRGTSRGSKPVHIGDLHMGLISRLQRSAKSLDSH